MGRTILRDRVGGLDKLLLQSGLDDLIVQRLDNVSKTIAKTVAGPS